MYKILIIEDNVEVRGNIIEILELSNYQVISAGDGKEGVELALKEVPDLIICDIMMPGLDGYGVLHLLKRHKEMAGIPFIFLTAKTEKTDLRKGMELGADDYITKPFEGIELLNAIETRIIKAESIKKKIFSDVATLNQFIENTEQSAHLKLTSGEREINEYKKKHVLYSEGQHPKLVYFIVEGKVKTFRINKDGKEFITNIYGIGDFFGYTFVMENLNYQENATILEDARLMLIPRTDFLNLLSHNLDTAKQFIKIISRDILEKEEYLLHTVYNSIRKRVAFGIIQLLEKLRRTSEKETVINISRENMANSIGIATESLIRTLSEFKDEKLIDLQPGKVIIINENNLRNLQY